MTDKLVEKLKAALGDMLDDYYGDRVAVTAAATEAMARRFLGCIEAAGMAIVPTEPTPEMITRGHLVDPLACDVPESEIAYVYGEMWRGMLAASPKHL